MSALRSFRRGRGRRYWIVGATLVAAAAFSVVFVAASGANLTNSTFEGNDGNMIVNTQGNTDWANVAGLKTLTDRSNDPLDNSFTQGTAEDNQTVTIADGSIPPNKNDLTRAYIANEQVGNDSFLYLAWERLVNIGSANIDFELDQNATPGWTDTTTGDVTINRTEGDLLITYDFSGSGTPTIGMLKWLTDNGTNLDSDCSKSGQTLPCWGDQITFASSVAEAAVNAGNIDETKLNTTLTAGLFGEASINLSNALIAAGFNPDTCHQFGSVFVKSRSSGSSFDSELKDFIAPSPIQVSNCASPTIATQTSVSSMSVGETQTVGDTATLSNGNNTTGDVTFTLYSDAACTVSTGVTGTGTLTAGGVATFAGAPFTPTAAGTYYWGVSYPGDNHNNPVSACGGANEEIVVNAPEIHIVKTADSQQVNAGDPIGFTMTVYNDGAGDAFGVKLSDTLPTNPGLSWTVASTGAGWGSPCSIDGAGVLHCGGANGVTVPAGTTQAGSTFTVHITSTTTAATGGACPGSGVVDNTGHVTTSNDGNDQSEATTCVAAPDVSITKTADHASPVNATEQIGFTVEVKNTGSGDATGVVLNDPLPAGSGSGVTWSVDNGIGTPGNFVLSGAEGSQTLTLASSTLPAGADYTIHIVAQTSATECGVYDNTATLTTGNGNNPNPATAEEACNPANIHIVKTADAAAVNAGDPIGFTMTVYNDGAGDAFGVKLSDTLPTNPGLSWTVASTGAGWGSPCSIDGAGVLHCGGANGVTVPAGTTQAGSTFTVHITSTTTAATGGACPGSGVVDNTGHVTTSNDGNDQSEATTCVASALVAITKTADHTSPVNAGDQIGFTVEVTNTGPGDATGVSLNDPLPAGSGSGVTWTVDTTTGTPAQFVLSGAKGSQTLSLGSSTLPVGADYTIHIVAQTSATECSTYDNTATLTTGNANNPDPASAAEACAPAQVSISKTADHSAPVLAGGQIGFTVEVKNIGSGNASGVSLNDPLPAGSGTGVTWAIDTASGTPGRFVLSGAKGSQTLSLASSTLPAGADYKVHLVAATSASACGTYDNTATLTTRNANNPGPASASESCRLPQIDLAVTKAGSPASQTLGNGNITWTMVVTNNGPQAATGVTIADPMPAGNSFVSATTSQGSCTGGAILHCTIGNMAVGAKVTITLVTTPSTAGTVTNTVTVVGNEHETNTANNTASASVQVFPFTPPVAPTFCVAVSKVTPKQLFVGRKTTLKIHVTKHGKAVKGVHVRIKGPKINMRTKASNSKGVITARVKMKKAGIVVFSPIASKRCNTKRVGVTGVFTPPVTG